VEPLLHELGDQLEATVAVGGIGEQIPLRHEQRCERRRGTRLNLTRGVHQLGLADGGEEQHARRRRALLHEREERLHARADSLI